jgi:hypothetical protein
MAGNDAVVCIHKDGVIEAELSYARGDLRNLRVGVGPRIPRVRNLLSTGHCSIFGA